MKNAKLKIAFYLTEIDSAILHTSSVSQMVGQNPQGNCEQISREFAIGGRGACAPSTYIALFQALNNLHQETSPERKGL